MFYLDTSAAVKLVFAEPESAAMRRWSVGAGDRVLSSDLLRTELLRVTRRVDPEHLGQARALLDSLVLLSLSASVCERAAVLEPVMLRSLDALHMAAALELGDDLEGVVTYDRRLGEGARAVGVRVVAPV
ncbi:MAG: type II toxin-antitoxin system VapC family toxin [Acidimicrobiia bacterium]|nr:type II toxin-antitoxin system VapC family toxin [Acidimicrobiia bacterium]MYF84321.1 type II toxin-antitoxin system VapC family toxin [Acidimicrobiia bacterium]